MYQCKCCEHYVVCVSVYDFITDAVINTTVLMNASTDVDESWKFRMNEVKLVADLDNFDFGKTWRSSSEMCKYE